MSLKDKGESQKEVVERGSKLKYLWSCFFFLRERFEVVLNADGKDPVKRKTENTGGKSN